MDKSHTSFYKIKYTYKIKQTFNGGVKSLREFLSTETSKGVPVSSLALAIK